MNENNDLTANQFPVSIQTLANLIQLVEQNKVSNSTATQKILPLLLQDSTQSPLELAQKNNWLQNSDAGTLEQIIDQVLAAMPDKVKEYQKGKKD